MLQFSVCFLLCTKVFCVFFFLWEISFVIKAAHWVLLQERHTQSHIRSEFEIHLKLCDLNMFPALCFLGGGTIE